MAKKLMIKFVRFYQVAISPYKGGNYCRMYPTCSQYAITAINKYGALKGGFMAFKRILRCNPLSKKWYDPVP